jgi:predicted flap endonuclease-1-like 5' DNA nuclease
MHAAIASLPWAPPASPALDRPTSIPSLAPQPVPCPVAPREACLAHRLAAMADLMRVRGIGDATAELLLIAGIDLGRLRSRKAEQIAERLSEANRLLKVLPRTPSLARIARWQRQAAALTPLVRF